MKVLFIVECEFPYGNAYSSRARNFLKLLISCNCEVHVISVGKEEKFFSLDKYTYEYIKDSRSYLKLSGIGRAKPYINSVKNYLSKNKVDIIISSNISFVVFKIFEIAKKNNIPYIIDQCEWYDSSSFKFGKYNPYYRECMKMIEYKNKSLDGIIAISRLFEKYYLNQEMKTIRIPTILDVKNILPRYKKENNKIINILFAGSLGKGKEDISPMLKAVEKLNKITEKIHLHFYGPTKEQIKENVGLDMKLSESYIHIYGRIPQEEVENKVREADFSFIIRPYRRSSEAGFPTKLAESMSVGTPVIANDTGDVGLYIENKKSGFLLKEDIENQLFECLSYILNMNENELEEMRKEARKTAEENFDYRNYNKKMKKFLFDIKGV